MEKKYRLLKNSKNQNITDYLLYNRKNIIDDLDKTFHDINFNHPFINEKEVIKKLVDYSKTKKKLGICCDCDGDGTGAAVILWNGLKDEFDLEIIFCERANGYGIQNKYYDKLKDLGVELVLSADIGITAKEPVEYGKSLGIETIVTDHHPLQQSLMPNCLIINPKLSGDKDYYYDLCGAGIVYFLIGKLKNHLKKPFDEDKVMLHHACISTIGDMVKLIEVNRLLVKFGLQSLLHTKSTGLKFMFEKKRLEYVDTTTSSFFVTPMVNSMNRIGDIYKVFEFFTTDSEDRREELYNLINGVNELRKTYQFQAIELAKSYISKTKIYNDNIMYLNLKSMKSINGLVSSYVTNYYGKPSLVVSEKDGIIAGSGRASGDFDSMNLINLIKDQCINVGGHKSAFGIAFNSQNEQYIINAIKTIDKRFTPSFYKKIDLELNKEVLSSGKMIELMEPLTPFGQENEEPMFYTKNLQISGIKTTERHSFITFKGEPPDIWQGNGAIQGNLFNYVIDQEFKKGDYVDIIYTINKDHSLNLDCMKHDLTKQVFKF